MKKTFQVGNLIFGEGVPKICVPVVAEKQEVIWKKAEEIAVLPADLVEWRVDFYEDVFEMEEVLRTLEGLKKRLGEKPLLFTFRTRGEGGNLAADPETYDLLLKSAARGGAELIDVEAYPKNGKTAEKIAGLQDAGAHVIASSHDFQRTPSIEEMTDRLRYMERLGADAVKLAFRKSGCAESAAGNSNCRGKTVRSCCHHVHGKPWAGQPHLRKSDRFRHDICLCGRIVGSGTDTPGADGRDSESILLAEDSRLSIYGDKKAPVTAEYDRDFNAASL